jgi:hypothetical protein
MRRFIHLIAVVVVVAAMMVLPGTALADSCFDEFAKRPGPGPGSLVGPAAQALGGNPGVVQAFQEIKVACP